MNWIIFWEGIYIILLIFTCLRIIGDTRSATKTLAYLLLVVFIPVIGMLFYFTFGINYRKRRMYSKKLLDDEDRDLDFRKRLYENSIKIINAPGTIHPDAKKLAYLLLNDSLSPVSLKNKVKILRNGEEKFPEVLQSIETAKDHIHLEYYIYEDDEIGRQLENLLIKKAKQGVSIRMVYDDFGSRSIRKNLVNRLREAGVQVYPFHKIRFISLANRINYRNHRKIIVIDGHIGFVGGINISDRYINSSSRPSQVYWRDTHLKLEGSAVAYLQYLFLCDWNFSANENLQLNQHFFPSPQLPSSPGDKIVQMAASGPDSINPSILFSILKAINSARKEVLITTPYLIPGESLKNALIMSALSGVEVKILVPRKSDSYLVNAAARSYYQELMKANVKIYRYNRGFIHAKTIVIDQEVGMVGTANMDTRSFDLNFEVNAILYDGETAKALAEDFYQDLGFATKTDPVAWLLRPWHKKLLEKVARLVSPLL